MSGEKYWIIDDDPAPAANGTMEEAHYILNSFEFNLNPEVYVNSPEWIVNNAPTYEQVMGYVSHGVNTAYSDSTRPRMPATYILDTLDFDYANGAIFNSWESFNGVSFGVTRAGHGLVSDFIHMGGTGGGGHVYEPFGTGAFQERIIFPGYSMGYSIVEAIYQGFEYMAWQNVVVGDPLTRIYECENTVISTNTTIGSGDYVCDVTVPLNVTLTIGSSAVVNFKRNSQLKIYGELEIESGAILNFDGYSKLVINTGGTITLNSGVALNFNDRSKYIFYIDLEIASEQSLVFNDESEWRANGILNMDINSSITFNDKAKLIIYDELNLDPGTVMNFNNQSQMTIYGSMNSLGVSTNKVTLNLSSKRIYIENGIGLEIDNTDINNSGIEYKITSNQLEPEYLSITNTSFTNPVGSPALLLDFSGATFQTTPLISNCTLSNGNCFFSAISLTGVEEITIEHNTLSLGPCSPGIYLSNNGVVNISDCIITGGTNVMLQLEMEFPKFV